MSNPAYINIPISPIVEEALKEWYYQQARISYCRAIIEDKPNTPAARNAQLLIDDIKMQLAPYGIL